MPYSKRSCGFTHFFLLMEPFVLTAFCVEGTHGASTSSSRSVAPTLHFCTIGVPLFLRRCSSRRSQRQFEAVNFVYPLQIYNDGVVQK